MQNMESTPSGVRVLHVGNVLLDRPIARLRTDAPENRRQELRDSFSRLLHTASERGVRLVLISGNLFDNAYVTNDTVMFLASLFSSYPSCHFVIAPGPKDAYVDDSVYRSGRFGRNVHIFAEENLSRFDFDDLGVTVYGWAYTSAEHTFSPLSGKRVVLTSHLSLVCGYGSAESDEEGICPLRASDVSSFGAHYVALSNTGAHEGFLRYGSTVLSSSGCFECTSFSTKEEGGVNFVSAQPWEDGAWRLSAKRVVTGEYRYAEECIDVSHLFSEGDVVPLLRERIRERGYGGKTALRVYLRGSVSPEASFLLLGGAADYGVYALEVVDQTVPTDGMEELLHDMSAKGELYRHLYRSMTEGTPESCARAARTFRVGYLALLGKDFTRH